MPITALVVEVPEAEVVVGGLRQRFDPSASHGVPAHVTVLVPFMDATELTTIELELLESLFEATEPFRYSFSKVGQFPDTAYLAPDDPAPFIRLTEKVVASFPKYPPYVGAFPDIVPHLTVAHCSEPGLNEAREKLHAWARMEMPIHGVCSQVLLLQQESGGWRVRQVFELGKSGA